MVGPINIAVKKGETDLVKRINGSLAKMREDGRMAAIKTKWGL